jgi:hypothetical protein
LDDCFVDTQLLPPMAAHGRMAPISPGSRSSAFDPYLPAAKGSFLAAQR